MLRVLECNATDVDEYVGTVNNNVVAHMLTVFLNLEFIVFLKFILCQFSLLAKCCRLSWVAVSFLLYAMNYCVYRTHLCES